MQAEEEVRALQKKMQQLENDLDQAQEQLLAANAKLEEKDKALQNVSPIFNFPSSFEANAETREIFQQLTNQGPQESRTLTSRCNDDGRKKVSSADFLIGKKSSVSRCGLYRVSAEKRDKLSLSDSSGALAR